MAYSNKSRDMMIEDRCPNGLSSSPWLPHYSGGCDQDDQRDVGWGSRTGWSEIDDLKAIQHEEVAAHLLAPLRWRPGAKELYRETSARRPL